MSARTRADPQATKSDFLLYHKPHPTAPPPPRGGSRRIQGENLPLPTRRNSRAVGKEFSCRRETFPVPSRIVSRAVEKSRSTGRDLAPARVRTCRRWGKAEGSARAEVSDRGKIVTLPAILSVIASRGLFPPRGSLAFPAMKPPIWSGEPRPHRGWGRDPSFVAGRGGPAGSYPRPYRSQSIRYSRAATASPMPISILVLVSRSIIVLPFGAGQRPAASQDAPRSPVGADFRIRP